MPNFSLPSEVFERAAAQFSTPFHLYDERGIRENARRLHEAFAWAPSYKEYFAVKALPNPQILNILKDEGCGADCSSECELLMAQKCGFSGRGIMFSANAMPPREYDLARALGAYINLDDITDIETLQAHGGLPEIVGVRYNPGGTFALGGNHIMGTPGESKYGWASWQMADGLKRLKSLGVKGFGLHAFLASNMTDRDYYPALAGLLFDVAQKAECESGLPLRFVNLSGGVGIPYTTDEKAVDIHAVGEGVRMAYEKAFGKSGDVAVMTELGRFMTGPYGWVVTRAMHEKKIYKHYIGVDACAVQLIRPAMYGAYHEISVIGREHDPATETYDITGSLCENNDKFAIDRKMPPIHMGDLLIIHDAGAHAFSMGYQYNGRLRGAEILYTENDDFRLIRRAETPEDYFSTLIF